MFEYAMETKGVFFQFEIIINVFVSSFFSSESNVYIRQILTFKVDPRAVRFKGCNTDVHTNFI